MAGKYFGTDGIRGKANTFPMTAEVAMKVGMAAGMSFQRGNHRHRVVIGKDTRLSGYMIENAMVAGFCAAGMDVFLLGPIPTPAVAMLARSLRADIGVMISASHNPYHDNGIKLFGPDGYKLSDEIEAAHRGDARRATSTWRWPTPDGLGRAKRIDGVHDRYIEFAKRTLPRVDVARRACASSSIAPMAPPTRWRPPRCGNSAPRSSPINVEPNGFNINEDCGSTHPAGLSKKVHEVRADIGIALDGDADRVIIVDENGDVVDGDQIMALIAEILAPGRPACRRRRRRHRHVQSRPRALPRRHRAAAAPHQGRRPLCRRAHARARLQCRRRAVRPYRAVGFLDHRRRAGLGAAGARLHQARRQAGERGLPASSSRCRRF